MKDSDNVVVNGYDPDRDIDAAMREMNEMKIPEGWPTREMIDAGRNTPLAGFDDEDAPEDYRAVFMAMLAAAPAPPAQEIDAKDKVIADLALQKGILKAEIGRLSDENAALRAALEGR